ncbi:MAG: RHS repeat-associated core domain-containing protein, partial [Lentisphaerota bacterium]
MSGRVYDPEGRVAQMINPLDEKSFVNYDKYGRVASRSGAGGYPLSFEYNSFGEIIAYTDGNGSKTKFEYDIAGRLVKRIWPDGVPVTYSYNDRGLLSQKLEGNRTTVYSYDTMNRLTKILIEDASASKGRARLAETASNGGSSSTSTAVIDRQSSTTLLSYSSTGKLISISDESGKIEFAYDSFGRVTNEKGAVGEIRYEYNNIGLLSAKECMFSHKDTKAQSFRTDYSYDNFDRITQVTSPAGTYSYKYDNKGQVASLASSTPGGTSSTSSASFTVNYSYDKAGRLVSKSFSPAVNGLPGEALAKSGERSTENGTLLCSYEYDKLDRRVKAEVNGIKWSYGYDNFNQLTSASSSDGYIYGYDFDTIGNRLVSRNGATSQSYKYNTLNQICSVSSVPSVGSPFVYDAYGNLTKSQDAEYVYDLHNRLTEVKKGNIRCEFAYDAFSRRIQKKIFTDGKLTKHLKFAYSGFNCVGEIDASSGKVLMNYVWNNNELLGAVDNESKSYSYLTDGNRNIIKILDSDRNSVAEYFYSPFSEQIKCSGDFAEKNPFRFSSEYFDSETGLVYYNFRYYSPELGRWINRDPIQELGGW